MLLLRKLEIQTLDEFVRFFGAVICVHAGITPFHAQRALVANHVQRANDGFPVDAAMARGAKLPTAARVAIRSIGIQDARSSIEGKGLVFDMHMEDTLGKIAEDFHRVDALPVEM